ncbi:ceramidase domain-containing protein [Rufibacter roseus]|uniref:ceramidase domain-containing protein n=1 Tax=Rufibacter roseus TaxID=1567108 RepID=UPI00082DCC2A|nr:ceramidase domain-containing protein [Rufibacter roseus]
MHEKGLHHPKKILLLIGLTIAGVVAVLLQDRIPQDVSYHIFADERELLGLPNFWNVVSNLPFVVIGAWAFLQLLSQKPAGLLKGTLPGYLIFFVGIVCTGLGSAYYHLSPSNQTLLWDRLPMTIAFMGFFSVILSEYVHFKAGKILLAPLLLLGAWSVGYWYLTELHGQGDLRFYVLVQFLPILLTPVILLLFSSPFNTNAYTWLVVLAYALAKVFETFDAQILQVTGSLSGHSIKHVLAGNGAAHIPAGALQKKSGAQNKKEEDTACHSSPLKAKRHPFGCVL